MLASNSGSLNNAWVTYGAPPARKTNLVSLAPPSSRTLALRPPISNIAGPCRTQLPCGIHSGIFPCTSSVLLKTSAHDVAYKARGGATKRVAVQRAPRRTMEQENVRHSIGQRQSLSGVADQWIAIVNQYEGAMSCGCRPSLKIKRDFQKKLVLYYLHLT